MEWLGHTPSWDMEFAVDHYEGKKYSCNYCGVSMENHETHIREGKTYCGCCAWK